MTVSTSSARKNTYTGNGSTTDFDYTFRIFDEDDLVATLRNTTTGVLTTKTITTHYTVSGVGNTTGSTDFTSGTVTFLVAPSASEQVILTSAIPAEQDVNYSEGDPFPAESHEKALDKLTLLVQELAERSGRGISTDSVTADTVSTVLTGTPTAGQVVGVNDAGTGLAFLDPTAAVADLGTMSTQAASAVAITGGTITGITDLTVADGGTGRSVTVAYTPICGGTTTTGAMQSVASVGTSGHVLTSNGAGALPTFQAAAAGGGWTYVSTGTNSGADCTFTGLTAGKIYKIVLIDACDTVASYPYFAVKAGGSFLATGYVNNFQRIYDATTSNGQGGTGGIYLGTDPGAGAGRLGGSSKMFLTAEFSTVTGSFRLKYQAGFLSYGSEWVTISGSGYNSTASAVTEIKFHVDGGDFAGTGYLYTLPTS